MSAISQSLRQLEEHVGTALIDRSTRPAGLTAAGEILLKAVIENRERLSEALNDIQALADPASASVTVACTVGFATYWLMPRLEAFYLDHPEIPVNVHTTQQESPGLARGPISPMRYGDGRWDDGTVEQMFRERVEPCAPLPLPSVSAPMAAAWDQPF